MLQKGIELARLPTNTMVRGRIFHFRRVVPSDLRHRIGRAELTCSLGTADLALAERRSRQLYLVSADLFAGIRQDAMLSENQLAEIVQDFYSYLLDEDNRARLRSLPFTEAKRRQRAGFYADVAANTRAALAKNDFESVRWTTLGILLKRKLVEVLTGDEVRQVQQGLLRAGVDLADALRARYEGDFNYEPRDRLLKFQLDERYRGHHEPPARSDDKPVQKNSAARSTVGEPTFSRAAEDFVARQIRTKRWEKQTAHQCRKSYELYQEVCGDKPLGDYEKKDAAAFKDLLEVLPAAYGKAATFRGKTAPEILALEEQSGRLAVDPRLSIRTVQRHMSALSALWEDAGSRSNGLTNIFNGFKFKQAVRAQDQRSMWTSEELSKLLATPIWAGCKSSGRRSTGGDQIIRDHCFWLPLLAIFTAAREEELCQLHVQDICKKDGIWVLDINAAPPRRLKNANAVRLIPLHEELLRLGFLAHVEECRRQGHERVFPALAPGGADGRLGHGYTKFFTRYRRSVGIYRAQLDFHSFRHSATTLLHHADVPDSIVDRLTGHATAGETARYTKGSRVSQLKAAIDKIELGLDLGKLYISSGEIDPDAVANA